MAIPRKHGTSGKTRRARSQKHLTPIGNLRPCPQCNSPLLPHRTCAFCGTRRTKRVRGAKSAQS